MDHVIRYHDDPSVKMIVVLGEVSEEGEAISAYACRLDHSKVNR